MYAVLVNSADGFFLHAKVYGPVPEDAAQRAAPGLGGVALEIQGNGKGPWVAWRAQFGYGAPAEEIHGFDTQLPAYEKALELLKADDIQDPTVNVDRLEPLPA